MVLWLLIKTDAQIWSFSIFENDDNNNEIEVVACTVCLPAVSVFIFYFFIIVLVCVLNWRAMQFNWLKKRNEH